MGKITPQVPVRFVQSVKSTSKIPLWFERKFEFAFPLEQYPNLCARLRGTPARLEDVLHGHLREILIKKPPEDQDIAQAQNKEMARSQKDAKWSAQEHAGHLLDLEPLWLARVADFEQGAAELTAADLTNRRTHEANHNARPVKDILAQFKTARGQMLNQLEQMDEVSHGRTARHPRLKTPMRLVDHLYFVAEHDDHHLTHIWALLHNSSDPGLPDGI